MQVRSRTVARDFRGDKSTACIQELPRGIEDDSLDCTEPSADVRKNARRCFSCIFPRWAQRPVLVRLPEEDLHALVLFFSLVLVKRSKYQ